VSVPGERIDDPGRPVRRGYVLGVLLLVYGCNYLDRQIFVILQEPIKKDMGLTDTQLGLLTGFSFAVVYVLAGIPIAYLADRGNRRNIITLAVTVWSAMTMLAGMAQSWTQLLLARVGVGLGEAGSTPPSHSMISDLFPPERRTTAFAFFTIGMYLGVAAGYLFGGQLGAQIGWRHALLLAGVPGLILAMVLRFTVREPLRGRWEGTRRESLSAGMAFRELASQPLFWLVTLAAAGGTFVAFSTGNFNPSYLMRSHGLSLVSAGTLLAITSSTSGILGILLGGVLVDRLGRRDASWDLRICLAGQALAVPFSVVAYLSNALPVVVVALFLSHLLVVFMLAPSVAVIQGLARPSSRALASAIFFFVANLVGMGLGPLSVGALSDAFAPAFGSEALRYAQVCASGVGLLAAALFAAAIVYRRRIKASGVDSGGARHAQDLHRSA